MVVYGPLRLSLLPGRSGGYTTGIYTRHYRYTASNFLSAHRCHDRNYSTVSFHSQDIGIFSLLNAALTVRDIPEVLRDQA